MYGTVTLYGTGFPSGFHLTHACHSVVLQPRLCRNITGLGSSPFARHYLGNHYYFLLLRLLRCFSSARSRIIQHTFSMLGYPIRKSPDQFACADPRRLSQLVTSFFASESLGIPRVPLFTFFPSWPFCYHDSAFGRQLRRPSVAFSVSSCFLPVCQRTFPDVILPEYLTVTTK